MSNLDIYKGKTVLITGHTGFKGSWLSVYLTHLGAKVVGYSLEPPSQPNMFDSIGLVNKIYTSERCNILNVERLKTLMHLFSPDIVFHLAAQPIVKESYVNPHLTFETNLSGTVSVLEALRKTNVKAAVMITSDKCYEDDPKPDGYVETDRLGGSDPYSSSKACAELAIAAYRNSFNMNVASTRAGNILGGGDWGKDRLVPDCIRQLSSGQKIIIRNPSHLRPWQFVLDPLYGYLLLGAKLFMEGDKYAQAWNFGPPKENYINVEELVHKIIKYWGSGEYSIVENPEITESKFLRLNCAKSNNILGWNPKYNIEKTLEKTISWYRRFYYDKKDLYEFTVSQIQKYMEE
jgi:CDP-glucose 4,6-dehydratase